MKLVEIKTQEDRLEAQRLKNLNKYVALIELLDEQASNAEQKELQTKANVKKFYIFAGIVIGAICLSLLGTVLLTGLSSVLANKSVDYEAANKKEPEAIELIVYEGDDTAYVSSKERLYDNDGTRLNELTERFSFGAPYLDGYTSELKDLYIIYSADKDLALRNRLVAIYEYTNPDTDDICYCALHMDNVKYNDDTSLDLKVAEWSMYNGSHDFGIYSDYTQTKMTEVDSYGTKYEIIPVIGGDEQ